ncbi:MAG: hypothetical protein ACO2Y7_06850, partial [Ilumatobacteraceae bacterium]
ARGVEATMREVEKEKKEHEKRIDWYEDGTRARSMAIGAAHACEAALSRLDSGTYWTDEITGQPLSDELLAERPLARRNEP